MNHSEGKTLIYQFNPRYPFLRELKAFLETRVRRLYTRAIVFITEAPTSLLRRSFMQVLR